MAYDPRVHHRRSIRLRNYDYSQPGPYFVTICAQDRTCLFGDVADQGVRLNDAGIMIQAVWDQIPVNYLGIDIDASVIMPNHFHGIIVVGAGPRACPSSAPRASQPARELSLPGVIQRFKTLTTKRYVDGVRGHGWQPFHGRLWQRNYWEHIVRDESELNRIREYIDSNPSQWDMDRLHPGQALRETSGIYGTADLCCADDVVWMM